MLTREDKNNLIDEITNHLGAKKDGGGKNIIARCPFCNKEGKFGIYIGKETDRKKLFMSNCFSCGNATTTLEQLLEVIGRLDLMITRTVDLPAQLDTNRLFTIDVEDEIDDSLAIIELPDFYKRCFSNDYLKSRGFVFEDYEYFPVGTTGRLNFKYNEYIIFPIIDEGDIVGYVSRHIRSKDEIDTYNRKAKSKGEYRIMRFRNSTENDFVKLLYNIDAVKQDETEVVIIVEGIFDVIALTRKLALYDNTSFVPVATFGKKISQAQIYKLQNKGVRTVVVGYDGDAVDAIKKTAYELTPYFDVLIADIENPEKDWEDLSHEEIYTVFSHRLKTPREYSITKIQETKWKN